VNEIVYVKAVLQGELPSGQKLVKLVASNTDGIKPFYTSAKDIIRCEDIFPQPEKTEKKHPDFCKKYLNIKNTDKASEIKASVVVE